MQLKNILVISLTVFIVLSSCAERETTNKKDEAKSKPLTTKIVENEPNYNQIIGATYGLGDGLGGGSITFNKDLTFKSSGFCDICPGSYSFGRYEIRNDTVITVDTLIYSTHPHFAMPKDTIYDYKLSIDTLYIWSYGDSLVLSDTTQYKISDNPERPIYNWTIRK